MQKKKIVVSFFRILIIVISFNLYSYSFSEIIIFKGCENGKDGFKKNEYTINLEKSLMTRIFNYDNKTYKRYRLTDINTKKENSITRFIYEDGNKILTDKIGYPQFYTQLVFDRNSPNVMIRTVINDEPGLTKLAKCRKVEKFQSAS